MTKINYTELSNIQYVDQALVWCVVELEHSNHHPNNFYLYDNAAIRAESKDFVSWQVLQDDEGNGQFIFTGLLPIRNPHPLLEERSILECVKSYTEYLVVDELITFPTGGYGMLLPAIPIYIDSMEKLLVWLVRLVEAVNRYLAFINYLIKQSIVPAILPNFDVDGDGTPEIQNIGSLGSILLTISTGESLISNYENSQLDDSAFPEWFGDAINNNNYDAPTRKEPEPVDPGKGNEPDKFDTLPVCKEQDKSVTSFSKANLYELLTKKGS